MPVATFLLSLLEDNALAERLSGPINPSHEHEISVASAYADKVRVFVCGYCLCR